jgi:hypothetical protein
VLRSQHASILHIPNQASPVFNPKDRCSVAFCKRSPREQIPWMISHLTRVHHHQKRPASSYRPKTTTPRRQNKRSTPRSIIYIKITTQSSRSPRSHTLHTRRQSPSIVLVASARAPPFFLNAPPTRVGEDARRRMAKPETRRLRSPQNPMPSPTVLACNTQQWVWGAELLASVSSRGKVFSCSPMVYGWLGRGDQSSLPQGLSAGCEFGGCDF